MEQRTDEWFAARLGKVTASKISDVMAKTKTGYGASRANYMARLIAERLTGKQQESFVNAEMQWGTDHEDEAIAAYSFREDASVEKVGFVDHPLILNAGASPDGLVGQDGLVEIKCPNTATHIETLLSSTIPLKYELQMLFQMSCTGRTWCDFVSYDPRMPEHLRLFVRRVNRDDTKIEEIILEVKSFLDEMSVKIDALSGLIL